MTLTLLDDIAGGYVRLRFVRALTSAMMWLAILLLPLLTFVNNARIEHPAELLCWVPCLVCCAPVGIVALLGMAALVVDVLPRQLQSALLLVLALPMLTVGLILGLYIVQQLLSGYRLPADAKLDTVAAFGVFLVWIGLLCAAGWASLRLAVWQLVAPSEDFAAARGWQPSGLSPVATFRRWLGLPGFLSQMRRANHLGFLYSTVALVNVGLLAWFFGPFFLLTPSRWWGLLLVAPLAAQALGLGQFAMRVSRHATTKVYQSVREWDARAPVVFLRRFVQDEASLTTGIRDRMVRFPSGVARSATIDELLLDQASPYGPVIAIGDPESPTPPLGAARVFVADLENASWQEVVEALVDASSTVVVCPGTSPGVRWELDLLARRRGERPVIYLASPVLSAAENEALFKEIAPAESFWPHLEDEALIAMFEDPELGWRVLAARQSSVEAFATGLNLALQRVHGLRGVPLPAPPGGAVGPAAGLNPSI